MGPVSIRVEVQRNTDGDVPPKNNLIIVIVKLML